jgi:signal transduction histidine kinase
MAFEENGTATHLYRIAQEAVRNAVRHGKARRIEVSLSSGGSGVVLTVSDNGIGLPEPERRGDGLGLRIMKHRAAMIGATFEIAALETGGTLVTCALERAGSKP